MKGFGGAGVATGKASGCDGGSSSLGATGGGAAGGGGTEKGKVGACVAARSLGASCCEGRIVCSGSTLGAKGGGAGNLGRATVTMLGRGKGALSVGGLISSGWRIVWMRLVGFGGFETTSCGPG